MKYCSDCKKEFPEDDRFCDECGGKLTEKRHEHKETHKEKKETKPHKEHKKTEKEFSLKIPTWIFIVGGVLLVLALIFIFAIPMPYTATEVSWENEPYTGSEAYSVREPYNDCNDKEADYNVEWGEWLHDRGSDYTGVEILVTNNEKESLTFGFKLAYYDTAYFGWCDNVDYDKANMYSEVVYKNIPPYQEKSFPFYTLKKNSGTSYCPMYYRESIPTVRVCQTNYKDVTKYKSITKYQSARKEKPVTKYATLFQRWSGNVKWYYEVGSPTYEEVAEE